jgi:hypothetical protein
MRIWFALLYLVAACASPGSADASSAPSSSVLQYCLDTIDPADDDAFAARACIGRAAADCIESDAGAETTAGAVMCYQREHSAWREMRDAFADELRGIESATQVVQLDSMLAEFERWSQVRCGYGASIYEGGSLSRVVAAACMSRLEGELALDLRARALEYNQR